VKIDRKLLDGAPSAPANGFNPQSAVNWLKRQSQACMAQTRAFQSLPKANDGTNGSTTSKVNDGIKHLQKSTTARTGRGHSNSFTSCSQKFTLLECSAHLRCRAKKERLELLLPENGHSQVRIPDLTGLFVPFSLDSGTGVPRS